MKKALEDIDGDLKAQQRTIPPPSSPSPPQKDLTLGIHAKGDGRYAMVNSIVISKEMADDKEYELTYGLRMLILYKKQRPQHYTSDDYSVYKAIVAQSRVRTYPNKRTGSARPRSIRKWKHMFSGMVIPGDMVEEEEEDEGSTEGVSLDGYRMPTLVVTPPPSGGKSGKRRKTREQFYKWY